MPIVVALVALPLMALLLMAVVRVEGRLVGERGPGPADPAPDARYHAPRP